MKHWSETAQVVGRAMALASLGRRSAIATVVRVTGSAYRRAGAKFLVQDDGGTLGGVSGGCLEADVREVALAVMQTGTPRLLHYDTGGDDRTVWGLGLGCYGSVDVFVQSASAPAAAAMVGTLHPLLDAGERFALCTVVDGPHGVGRWVAATAQGPRAGAGQTDPDSALLRLATACLSSGSSRLEQLDAHLVFAELFTPPPVLIVCGAGDDARPLVGYAIESGFRVTVVDHRPALATPDRFPPPTRVRVLQPEGDLAALGVDAATSVVIQTHSLAYDREWLRRMLQTDAAYIGLLGPRGRKEEIVQQVGAADEARVFGPVGLDLAADGPEQIAISIVAELLAVRGRRQPRHLRDRRMAIHAS